MRPFGETVRRRPPLCSPAQLLGMTALLFYAFLSWQPWLMILVALGGTWWLGTWLLAPYSRFAFQQRQPTPEQFERYRRLAERMKTMPILGPVFRWGDRMSVGLGEKISAEYEKWIREHGVDDPYRKVHMPATSLGPDQFEIAALPLYQGRGSEATPTRVTVRYRGREQLLCEESSF